MAIVLFALWLLLNGRFTADAGMVQIVVTGVVVVGVVCLFAYKALDITPAQEWAFWRRLPLLLVYAGVLVWEILKANWQMIRLIFRRNYKIQPVIVKVNMPLCKTYTRVILANSITLTPGTITVDTDGEEFTVYCIDREFSQGLDTSAFVKWLERVEK